MRWPVAGIVVLCAALMVLGACNKTPVNKSLELLYFMSFQCPGCRQANPLLESLHQKAAGRYSLSAFAFGTTANDIAGEKARAHISFPVAVGDKKLAGQYGVRVTPTVMLLEDGEARERYQGVAGVIRLQQTIESGMLGKEAGILEIARNAARYAGQTVAVRGQLAFVGTDGSAVIGNGVETLRLVLPADVKSPGRELIGKTLRVQGQMETAEQAARLRVQQWEPVS